MLRNFTKLSFNVTNFKIYLIMLQTNNMLPLRSSHLPCTQKSKDLRDLSTLLCIITIVNLQLCFETNCHLTLSSHHFTAGHTFHCLKRPNKSVESYNFYDFLILINETVLRCTRGNSSYVWSIPG